MHRSMAVELLGWIDDGGFELTKPKDHTPVSWDANGNILSRFGDVEWIFQKKSDRTVSVAWVDNVGVPFRATNEAMTYKVKQLALLKMSFGSVVSVTTLVIYLATLKKLLLCAIQAHCDLAETGNHPGFFDNFTFNEKERLAAVARLSLGAESKMGWAWLSKESISNLFSCDSPESNQTPVIPFMLWDHTVDEAEYAAHVFLRYLPELTEICIEYAKSRRARATRGKTWVGIISCYPEFYSELDKMGCLVENFVSRYMSYVASAAFWLIASGSGARRSEIEELERDCYSERDIGGITVGVITGATTKTLRLPATVWIVSPRAKLGVNLLEARLKWYQQINPSADPNSNKLFQNIDFTLGRHVSPSQVRSGKIVVGSVLRKQFKNFLCSLNGTTITRKLYDEAVALTPTLDREKFSIGSDWSFSPHQARRTVFMLAAATGLVSRDSVALQAKHRTLAMTDYYTNFFWRIRIEYPDDPLAESIDLEIAQEILTQYVKNYNQDLEQIASQERFFSPYGDSHKRQVVQSVPMLDAKEIQHGLKAEVLKRSTLGLCSEMGFCPHHSAISVRGCMVKANGSPCGKAIIDSDRIELISAVQNDQRLRLESIGKSETFEREQIEADIVAAQNAIDLILSRRERLDE